MLPATQDIFGDGVEIVTAMLVTIIVVVTGGESISRVFARVAVAVVDVVIHNAALTTSENKNSIVFSKLNSSIKNVSSPFHTYLKVKTTQHKYCNKVCS